MKKSLSVFLLLLTGLTGFLNAFNLQDGLDWLGGHDYSNEFVGGTSFALMGLSAHSSPAAVQSNLAAILQGDLNNNASWSWAEADIPAMELWALYETNYAQGIDAGTLTQKLYSLKGASGGFKGLFECVANCDNPDWTQQVWEPIETTTDTALALIALRKAGTLDDATKNAGISFLYSLQNSDGSFKQTPSSQETQLYALGPDLVSTTALALVALKENGAENSQQYSNALNFLKQQARDCFGDLQKVYGPSIASIAFSKSGLSDFSSSAAEYAVLNQNADGGFADRLRSSTSSNALDTGAVVFSAENIQSKGVCAPLSASLSFNSEILVGNTQNFVANIEGAVNEAHLLVTLPNSNLVGINMTRLNQTAFQASFQQTQSTGNYTAMLVLKPKYGADFMQSWIFSVKTASPVPSPTPTPTVTPTPTPTPTPAPTPSQTQPQEVRVVVATPSPSQSLQDFEMQELRARIEQNEIELRNLKQNQNGQSGVHSSQSAPSSTTGFALAQTGLFDLSIDGKNIALSFSPLVLILTAILIVIYFLYERWSFLKRKVEERKIEGHRTGEPK